LEAIIDRAEGVPLYAVETIRMLIDRGSLVAEGSQLRLAGDLPPLAVPETLHALIAARLDALAPEERTVVTDAAVLGLSFTVGALEGITGFGADVLAQHLDDLGKRELLVLDVDPLSAERGQYRFIQGVVREVAYQSLAKRDRRAKHLAAARYFESLGEDELAGVLASHYLAAYRASPSGEEADTLAAQARVALRAAADRATALHAPHGALEYLEQALEVTNDPLEQAALHERAAAAATAAAKVRQADEHARLAGELYAAQGDRLGILRSHTAEAFVKLAEHGDQVAIGILRDALSEVADLPSAPEIVEAQSELARALMLQGAPEALVWSDRVLENPASMNQRVLVNTLITRGSILLYMGRLAEAEALLRGCVVLADRLGDPMAMLRARNNMGGAIEAQSVPDVLNLARELYDIAVRFGERTWIQQAIGVGLIAGFESGRWDEWSAEAEAELPETASFYRHWIETERARRLAYRGQVDKAVRVMEEALADQAMKDSAQAMAGMAGLQAEIAITQGRWIEAFEVSRGGWTVPDSARYVTQLAEFAAAAAGDAARLREAVEAQAQGVTDDSLISQAAWQVGSTLTGMLAGRWEEGRLAYLQASRLLEELGATKPLALLQLAVGHIAADRFPEAEEAADQADEFFGARGAESFVATYRAKAARHPAAGSVPQAATSDPKLAEAEPSSR
jgi:tetratricopeptide (TPR) repeat protein